MKKLLLVSYNFPTGNMGAIRMHRIARALPEFGYKPTVVTHAEGTAEGIQTIPVEALNLVHLYRRLKPAKKAGESAAGIPVVQNRLTSVINRWLLFPDKFIPWLRPAKAAIRERMKSEKFDLVFASFGPATNLLLGAWVQKTYGIPLVVEFRDLWIGNPYAHLSQPTAVHRARHKRAEQRVLESATKVTCVCRRIGDYLSERLPEEKKPALNYNFFDPEEYPPIEKKAEPFVISYVGNMYASRSPFTFFEGFARFIETNELTPEQIRFVWNGIVVGIDGLDESIDRLGLGAFIEFGGSVPHREALGVLQQSDLALILQAPDDAIHIPGKLFEAMGAGTPVLALANPCEVTEIIDQTNCGRHVPYEPDAIAAALTDLWRNKTRPFKEPEAFRIDRAVKSLAELFDHAIESS